MPYALIPIGLAALLAYGFTFIISRAGLISPIRHRQLWNTALLFTFFTTAVLGIILAVQVNYKLDMPVVEKLLAWHVDFGIGMSFIAVFHFTWHWSYYRRILQGKRETIPVQEDLYSGDTIPSFSQVKPLDILPVFSLGATALASQVIFLREYLAVFHGNELVIGIILAAWLLLTGTGALLGKNIKPGSVPARFSSLAFYVLGILPVLTVTGIRFFKNIAFPVGSMPGIPGILLYSTASMAVFCLLSGFLFTWLSSWISIRYKSNLLNFSYGIESAGSIAAGILFSFVLVYLLNTFQILFLVLLLNLFTGITRSTVPLRKKTMLLSGFTALVFAILIFWIDLDSLSRAFLYKNQQLIETRDTPYGNLVITRTGEQFTLFENSSPVAVTADVASIEEDVHYAMVQHPKPESILIFSGNLSALTEELLKYPVRKADFVELDPWITRIRNRYLPQSDIPWLNVINQDGRRFLAATEEKYDVVLINLPPPGSARMNRFFTAEFFEQVKSHMNPGGILSIPLQGTENYMSMEAGSLFSILYHTLRLEYENILLIPGYKTYFLASDADLNPDISFLIDSGGIETVYVNSFYLDTATLLERSRQLMTAIPETADINRDFHPLAFLHQINYWLSYFRSNLWITLGIFMVVILLIGFRTGPLTTGIFITGFTGMGIELAILLAIQIIFGYVYLYTAVVLTVFMSGLAAGALSVRRILPNPGPRHFAMLQILLATCVFLVYWWLILIEGRKVPGAVMHFFFLALTFLASSISGLLFATAAFLRKQGIACTAGTLYSADLAGSAAGALIMAVLLIPLLGLNGSLLILLLLNMLAALYSLFRKNYTAPN